MDGAMMDVFWYSHEGLMLGGRKRGEPIAGLYRDKTHPELHISVLETVGGYSMVQQAVADIDDTVLHELTHWARPDLGHTAHGYHAEKWGRFFIRLEGWFHPSWVVS